MRIHNRYDKLQKMALILFAQAMLKAMGDTRKIVRFYPTELIIPTFRQKLMDGVLELEDRTLLNIEFITGDIDEDFLLRCAQYAINLRIISGRHVETKIISTGFRIKSDKIALISKTFRFEPEIFFYSELDGLEKLINIKNKIRNNEKLTDIDQYNLIFIPFMGNVGRVDAAFDVIDIVNNRDLFTEHEREQLKECQYIMADIVADRDDELFEKFIERINMLTMFASYVEKHKDELDDMLFEAYKEKTGKDFEERIIEIYGKDIEDKIIEKHKKEIKEENSIEIARNLKDICSDEEISKCTGLPIEKVREL